MSITFVVDDVPPERTQLDAMTFSSAYPGSILASEPLDSPLVHSSRPHSFFAAVDMAYRRHLPLVLTPDSVWLVIAQGFSNHVNVHSEALRSRFVRHPHEKELVVDGGGVLDPAVLTARFSEFLEEHVNAGVVRLITADFSTTTDADRVASQIVMMETFQKYFHYGVMGICGIPTITLTGTPADWRKMVERVRVMGEFNLRWWTDQLGLFLEKFVAAAEGKADREFFKRIIHPRSEWERMGCGSGPGIPGPGPERTTGWIARFFPYLRPAEDDGDRNPLLAVAEEELADNWKWHQRWLGKPNPGILTRQFPNALSKASVRIAGEDRAITLAGGFLGVRQAREDASVTPAVGWLVENGMR